MDRGWGRITGCADPRPMRSTHYQLDKPKWHHFTPMRDPTGLPRWGKGIAMDCHGVMFNRVDIDILSQNCIFVQYTVQAVRDIDILSTLDIGVQALGTVPIRSEKKNQGKLGVDLTFGGLTFSRGNFVYADNNGLLLSKTELELT